MARDTFAICVIVFYIVPLVNAEVTLDPEKVTFFMLSGNCADKKIPGTNLQDVYSCLDPTLKTVIIVHGFLQNCTEQAVYIMVLINAYQELKNYNVICMDWSPYCNSLLGYMTAVVYTKLVADLLVSSIAYFDTRGIDRTLLDLVGFSLGAQIVGMTGNCITNPPLYRIIGLDVAFPGYYPQVSDIGHITPNSATIVVVVHSDGGCFGVLEPCGTHDFFPNCGCRNQPKCFNGLISDSLTVVTELPDTFTLVWCSHVQATVYFSQAITCPGSNLAIQCDSCSDFLTGNCQGHLIVDLNACIGSDVPPPGIYYYRTDPEKNGIGISGTYPSPLILPLIYC